MEYIENYIPGSISFAEGFMGPRGDVGFTMLLDRKKAKSIVNKLLKEGLKIKKATMGLDGDWAENNEILFKDNKFIEEVNFRMYEYSVWAKPIMVVEFKDIPSRTYEVWKKVNEN